MQIMKSVKKGGQVDRGERLVSGTCVLSFVSRCDLTRHRTASVCVLLFVL
jgi:hypothetical protein